MRREQVYRGTRAPVQLKDQVVILIDDGLATGASMLAAVQAARLQAPSRIVVAVPVAPVAPVETAEVLRGEVDELVCPLFPDGFTSIGHWYVDFSQTSDAEVIGLLQRAWRREDGSPDANG
ncbi:putative phosphoribosyl transferase [compost metagenome]